MSEDERTPPPGPSEQETESYTSAPGTSGRIGPYCLLQKIGEGGMGEVWAAEQQEPVRRRVALKIIKRGMDTKQVIARFEAERQALAMMNHPNIAKIFDAGETADGRPFFVMEYVKGVPITEHCDRQRLSTRERLELFAQVCEGVQHAHQKAIIHRDLKPSNVLVMVQDGKSVPKIIDFGVAKAIEHRLTERTLYTELGQIVGTPEYMSPEQAEMTTQDVDTRTDVYSLGVILYELLVGALPFDPTELREAGFDEIRRKIREDEPSKPSTRISTLGEASTDSARKRRTEPYALARDLRGDLDWITMKALDKDRSRRYASPQELAADVGRHLNDEPVLAGPPSAAYRAGKFARRHRVSVGAAAAGVLVLVAFAVTMAVQAKRIAAERDRVEQARADLESVVGVQSGMLSEMDTEGIGSRLMMDLRRRVGEVSRGRGLSDAEAEAAVRSFDDAVRGVNATDAALRLIDEEILARAVEPLEEKFAEQPQIDARLRETIGNTYLELGLYERAEPQLETALATRKRVLGDEHRDTLRSMHSLAALYQVRGRYDEAETLYLETLEAQKRVLGDEHPDTLRSMHSLTIMYDVRGRHEAETFYLETLEAQKRVLGDEHPDTLLIMYNLATLYHARGRYDEAETLFREALESRKRVLGDEHPDTLHSVDSLAALYFRQGRYDEAETLYLKTLESRKRVLGGEHPDTLRSMYSLAALYAVRGRYDEAETLYLETLEAQKRVLGDEGPDTLGSMYSLAALYAVRGRYDEAETLYLETLEALKRVLGDEHPDTLLIMRSLAALYQGQGRYDDADTLFREALETAKRVLGDEHPDTLYAMLNLADLYQRQERFDEAQTLYLGILETEKRTLGDEHPDTLNSMNTLAWFLLTREPTGTRDPWSALELALMANEGTAYEDPPYLDTLALAYHLTGDTAKAVETAKKALSLLPDDAPDRAEYEQKLTEYQVALQRSAK